MELPVSVIIPVYNVFPYLREAVDSVISQTYRNLEIIIIDDGSSDGSGEVCDEYKTDPRVRVVHQRNRGLSAARNTGLDIMTGDYTMFLDSDDVYHPDMVEKMVNAIIKSKADLVICSYNEIETEGRKNNEAKIIQHIQDYKIITAREALLASYDDQIRTYAWNKIYPGKIWDHLRYPEGHVYEDMFVFPDILEQCERILLIPDVLVDYRQRKDSITHTGLPQNILDSVMAKKYVLKVIEETSPSFPKETIDLYKRKQLHKWIFGISLLPGTDLCSETEAILKKEIQILFDSKIKISNLKISMIWWLYRNIPQMIPSLHKLYHGIKHLIGINA